jgi:hypothetical protein
VERSDEAIQHFAAQNWIASLCSQWRKWWKHNMSNGNPALCFIGFGEAGQAIAAGLR